MTPDTPTLATLRAELATARNTRDAVQQALYAAQREVTRLRLAVARAEKEARR